MYSSYTQMPPVLLDAYPVNTVNWTAVNGLLQHFVTVYLLLHDPGSAKVRLHGICLWAHICAVVAANARQLINKHLHCLPF